MSPRVPGSEPDAVTEVRGDASQLSRTAFKRSLEVSWTDASGAHTASLESRAIVGSSGSVDIVVGDPTVSRLHAEFDPRDDGIWVRDLGSRNGTWVEDIRVTGARLPARAKVRLGST